MFLAVVVVCSVSAGACVQVVDEEHKFETKAECVEHLPLVAPSGASFLKAKGVSGPYKLYSSTCETGEPGEKV